MDGWDYYIEKKVFIILKSKRQYSGIVCSIDHAGNGLIFLSLIDKFEKKITFVTDEIELCQEEKD